jgi:hypothetical protein
MTGWYTKKEIQDAMLTALGALSVEGGGYVRVLQPYSGALDEANLLAEALQLPAIFVSYASSTYVSGPQLSAGETMSFAVTVICRNGQDQDAFRMIEDVRAILYGGTLGLSVSPMRLSRENLLSSTRETTVISAVYSLTQTISLTTQQRNI